MPLYEYRCDGCGEVFEVQQKFSDPPLAMHESCGGRVERLISAPAIQFKGSGWYITDYARGKAEAKADGSKPDATKAESATTESKSDSKPAVETATKPASDK
jgi:putative FmdB family regulatory protein